MRHLSNAERISQGIERRREQADRTADRVAADVAAMHDDELCEVVGRNPASDSPFANDYFVAAAREIVRRVDEKLAGVA